MGSTKVTPKDQDGYARKPRSADASRPNARRRLVVESPDIYNHGGAAAGMERD